MPLDRRAFLALMPATLIACAANAPPPAITVHRSPSCGCCLAWVEHLRGAGFEVAVVEVEDTTPVARRLGVPDGLRSCHTAEVAGYAIEGHVPAADIRRLLAERPAAAGLAVPGMPIGAPGMEMGGRREAYATMLFDRAGGSRVFAEH